MSQPEVEPSALQARDRNRREREHFEGVVRGSEDLYWADRTEAGKRRQLLRSQRIVAAAGLSAGTRTLDVGCGTGTYTAPMSELCSGRFVAIDVAPALLRVARERTSDRVEVVAADAGRLPFDDGSFDAVIGNAVLHHLPLDGALRELGRVLRPGGTLCFAEPNMLNPQVFLERNIPYLRRLMENSEDETAFVRWPLRRSLERQGFERIGVVPFDFLYPLTPEPWIAAVERLGGFLERTPLVREIAGSLLIRAQRAA